MKTLQPHLWQGRWVTEEEFRALIPQLPNALAQTAGARLDLRAFMDACETLSQEVAKGPYAQELESLLRAGGDISDREIVEILSGISDFLRKESLEEKLRRELGSTDPLNLSRTRFDGDVFEAWAPLGFLVHVAPTNSASVGFLSVIEGLLAGNVNFLKTGGDDTLFCAKLLKMLVDADRSGMLAQFVYCARLSSRSQEDRGLLKQILVQADGVAAWGGEAAISGLRDLSPAYARFVDWGPKISFVYVAHERLNDEALLREIARECCAIEQQACSSPQCVFVESEDRGEIDRFSQNLALAMEAESPTVPRIEPDSAEQAEITSTKELCRLEACLDLARLIESKDGSWRILIDYSSELKTSPLFRTVRIKPLPKLKIISALRPSRAYLQTAALACDLDRAAELGGLLINAGVLRITEPGKMLNSYMGEPHDGVYALQRYSRRVSYQSPEAMRGISSFSDLEAVRDMPVSTDVPVLTKDIFQNARVEPRYSQLFFKSGGSSGDPKLSVFTYEDYHRQMQLAAEGLYAAGLDPAVDRCMNLFFAGGLYGGFVSFFTILEQLRAVQFPMGAHTDSGMVARTIVDHRVNVLLGMPSYLIQLFRENEALFRTYGGVEKIFYGGEHFNALQQRHFYEAYGVKVIKSASYGSVDAGPLGYQCRFCEGSVHHLHSRLHRLEILDLERNDPVSGPAAGRLIFSSFVRKGQRLTRYEIGDVGRWVSGKCPCGRKAKRFELLGRHGDVFRIGATFFSYGKFGKILSDHLGYCDELQIRLRSARAGARECLRLLALKDWGFSSEALRSLCLSEYKDLAESVLDDKILDFEVELISAEQFEKTPGSGKLRHVIDERTSGSAGA